MRAKEEGNVLQGLVVEGSGGETGVDEENRRPRWLPGQGPPFLFTPSLSFFWTLFRGWLSLVWPLLASSIDYIVS